MAYKGWYSKSRGDKVKVTVSHSSLDTQTPGVYTVVYHVVDKAGYNFHVKHYIKVQAVKLTGIYNPNYLTEDTYKVSTVGDNLQLRPRFNHQITTNDVEWQSSDDQVASVSSNGVVSAKQNGIALITATFHGEQAVTPVLVTDSSHLPLTSSDDLLKISFDEFMIAYDIKGDLMQYPTGIWVTNGQIFGYSNGIDSDTSNEDHRDHIVKGSGGIDTLVEGPESLFKPGSTILLQTKDEYGQAHQYVGQYQNEE